MSSARSPASSKITFLSSVSAKKKNECDIRNLRQKIGRPVIKTEKIMGSTTRNHRKISPPSQQES
jgi:endonuclease V-like protein UPF0215 family